MATHVFTNPTWSRQERLGKIMAINYKSFKATLSLEPYKRNRFVGCFPDNFIRISFASLRFGGDANHQDQYNQRVRDVLTRGVLVGQTRFIFCGHSNSQLRSRSCYLICEYSHWTVAAMVNEMGDFQKIRDVRKRSKRIGLLFSNGVAALHLRPGETAEMDDIVRGTKNYTDGCGLISQDFAKIIQKKISNQQGNMGYKTDYIPTVFQIRYQGYKGTLMAETADTLKLMVPPPTFIQRILAWILFFLSFLYFGRNDQDDHELNVVFRKSMKKFSSSSDELFIVEHSKPSSSAKLNSELVSILSSLGVPNEIFMRRLNEYFDFIGNASITNLDAKMFLEYKGRYKLIAKMNKMKVSLLNTPVGFALTEIRSSQCEELKAFFDKNDLERLHIMIPKSRHFFGICDTSGKLKEGQCMVKYTSVRETLETVTLTGKILVGRNPCFHPGDIQFFEAVDIPELNHLVDCIIFSTEGNLPPASQLSGGDLDGDKFFICWDPELFPRECVPPFDYSLIESNNVQDLQFQNRNQQLDLINYFANYSNNTLGVLTTLYSEWIRANVEERAFSQECLKINELYSKAVDGEEVDIPEWIDPPPPPQSNSQNPFILDILIDQMKEILDGRFQYFQNEFENQKAITGDQIQEN